MQRHVFSMVFAGALFFMQGAGVPAHAENSMGYRVLSLQEAGNLPRGSGALGMDVARAQQITDSGMIFSLMSIKKVRSRSAGAHAGFKPGDLIIAVDGRVFPTVGAFGSYIASRPPGSQAMVDYIPAGGAPANAQRVAVTIGNAGGMVKPKEQAQSSTGQSSTGQSSTGQSSTGGMSTGAKVAIGAGAAAILCYKLGCFSHEGAGNTSPGMPSTGTRR